jgi:hypothetical protein
LEVKPKSLTLKVNGEFSNPRIETLYIPQANGGRTHLTSHDNPICVSLNNLQKAIQYGFINRTSGCQPGRVSVCHHSNARTANVARKDQLCRDE